MDNAAQNGKDLVVCLHSLFELNVFVPEGMSKKIKTNTIGTTLEEASWVRLARLTLMVFGGGTGAG